MANVSIFYFAWVNSTEMEFGESHMREDELIFSFELRHEEGEIAELEIEIINPHIGLLAPGRPLWAWFSWSDGIEVFPLFFGRLFSVPDDLFAGVITLKFVARPKDYVQQKIDLAESMMELPFFDHIFFDSKKTGEEEGREEAFDPDIVLEGYSKLWHVDRIDLEVTASDIIAGEDGIEEFLASEVFYDSVEMKISGAPLIVYEIDAEVKWVQCDHTGVFEMRSKSELSGDSNPGGGFKFANLRPQAAGIQFKPTEWPTNTDEYKNKNPTPADGELMEETTTTSGAYPFWGSGITTEHEIEETPANKETGQGAEVQERETRSVVTSVTIEASQPDQNLEVETEVEQDRTEVLHVRVVADLQPVLTEATEEDDHIKEKTTMNARDLVEAEVLTPSDGAYFPTARGLQSAEFLLMVARAKLLEGSRVVETSWETSFARAVYAELSCRKNATLQDSRLPGGTVLGKIVGYELTGNGDDGEFLGKVEIKSSVGKGTAIVTAPGVPVYVDPGYVDVGYQHYSGTLIAATTNDMAFEPLAYSATGIQLPVTQDQVLVRHEFYDGGAAGIVDSLMESASRTGANYTWSRAVDQAYADNPSWVEIEFKPIQKISTDVDYDAHVNPLVVPKQIDLAAPSTP